MKNKKIYVLIVCLAVVLTGCWLNLEKKAAAPEAVKEAVVVNEVATSTELLATTTVVANGETFIYYKDFKNGFELKYPETWKASKENDFSINRVSVNEEYVDTDSIYFSVQVFYEKISDLESWLKNNENERISANNKESLNVVKASSINIFNKKGFYREGTAPIPGGIFKDYFFSDGVKIYFISTFSRIGLNHPEKSKEYEDELKGVFDSFSLIE